MKHLQRLKLVVATLAVGLSFSAGAAAPASPSVVLVHGAFADGSDWAKVIPLLQAKGVNVVAVQNPPSSARGRHPIRRIGGRGIALTLFAVRRAGLDPGCSA